MWQVVEVVRYGQGDIDLLSLYRSARQVLSASPPPPPPLFSFKVILFPDLSDLGEPARQSSPVCRLGLSPTPSP